MSSTLHRSFQSGVTLVEVLIVIMIAAIMATLGAPAFSTFMNNTRQSSLISQLMADINRARSEAIKRNSRVLICNANTAGSDCTASTDWSTGWLVCYDVDANNSCDTTTATDPNPIIRRSAIHQVLTLNSTTTPIRFNPTGTQGSGGGVTLTVAAAGAGWSGSHSRTLAVSVTGNILR